MYFFKNIWGTWITKEKPGAYICFFPSEITTMVSHIASRLCSRFMILICIFISKKRLVETSKTISKCSIEDTKRIPSTAKPLKGFV